MSTPWCACKSYNKNHKNPFVQAKTLFLMLRLYAFPCKQDRSKNMHPHH